MAESLAASRRADPGNTCMLASRCSPTWGDWLRRAAFSYIPGAAISRAIGNYLHANSFGHGYPGAAGAACLPNFPGYTDYDEFGRAGAAAL